MIGIRAKDLQGFDCPRENSVLGSPFLGDNADAPRLAITLGDQVAPFQELIESLGLGPFF